MYANKEKNKKNGCIKNNKKIVPIRLDIYINSRILDPKYF